MIRVMVAGVGAPRGGQEQDREDQGPDVATALRNGGMEAIFTGWDQTPAQVARGAVQEDVDAVVVCLGDESVLADVREALAAEDAADVLVLAAGTQADAIDGRLREWVDIGPR